MALILGRRELRRNGTYPPREFNELVAMLADRNGPERTQLDDVSTLPEPDYVDLREGARRLSISERTVRRLVASGQLPAVRVGRRVLLRVDELREYGTSRDVG
jgi:excisionase family DNA binding protein